MQNERKSNLGCGWYFVRKILQDDIVFNSTFLTTASRINLLLYHLRKASGLKASLRFQIRNLAHPSCHEEIFFQVGLATNQLPLSRDESRKRLLQVAKSLRRIKRRYTGSGCGIGCCRRDFRGFIGTRWHFRIERRAEDGAERKRCFTLPPTGLRQEF